MTIFTDIKFTQAHIAKLLNISSRQVRNLEKTGVLRKPVGKNGYDPLACIHSYIAYKTQAETPAQNDSDNSETGLTEAQMLELEEQRLKIADKRETVMMKKAKRVLFEKSYAPLEIIVDVLQQLCGQLASRHDSLISQMKLAWPDMPQEAVETLEAQLTAAANECADLQPDLSGYIDSDQEENPEWLAEPDPGESGDGD